MTNLIESVILKAVIRSDCITDTLKLMVLSYFFFNLCWDFNYYELCSDIESSVLDYKMYDFESIQNLRSEIKKG